MVLPVIKYGNPILRKKGARIESITPEIKELIADMFETMRAAHGIGLAAQQIGHAMQLTIIDVRGVTDRPSSLELDGKPADIEEFMPLVLINPEFRPVGDQVKGSEGCLSFPEIFGEVSRAETIDVVAMNEKGERLEFRCGGLLARAIQHETDHLNGILFIDRMEKATKEKFQDELDLLQAETKAMLKKQPR